MAMWGGFFLLCLATLVDNWVSWFWRTHDISLADSDAAIRPHAHHYSDQLVNQTFELSIEFPSFANISDGSTNHEFPSRTNILSRATLGDSPIIGISILGRQTLLTTSLVLVRAIQRCRSKFLLSTAS